MTRLPALGPRGEGWLALQLLVMALIVGAGLFLGPALGGAARTAAAATGALLLVGGVVLVAAGVRALDRAASPLPHPVAGGRLVEHGVYRQLRHPIYAGVVVSAAGWAMLTASPAALILVVVLAALLDLKARREEAWLRERYPAYAEYERRTRRFIPGLY